MLTRFITRRIALTSEIFSSFGKKKIPADPREWNEPCYYTPLPQATPPPRPAKLTGEEIVQKLDRFSLHPHSYWLTQGKGTERPFTGKYWDTKELGHYTCIVCHQKLFLSDGKYQTPLGVATFWDVLRFAVKLEEDVEDIKSDNTNLTTKLYDNEQKKKRVCCSKCNSHLGTLHHDGPAPTFKRYTINSGAVVFTEKPWFHPPQYYKQMRLKDKDQRSKNKAAAHRKRKIETAFVMDKEKFRKIEEDAKPAESNPLSITREGREAVDKMKPAERLKALAEKKS